MLSIRTGLGLGFVQLGLVASWFLKCFVTPTLKYDISIQSVDTEAVVCVHPLQYSNCHLPDSSAPVESFLPEWAHCETQSRKND